jgi:hypothetical protein
MKAVLSLLWLLATPLFANDVYWIEPQETPEVESMDNLPTPSSPPREFFSMNTLYLRDKIIVHIGHDLINQSYVVLPSPNITKIEVLKEDRRRVTIQQYFPDLQEKILSNYNITANKLHFLYIKGYEIYDQDGVLIEKITIPQGVQYRPPQFYTFEVSKNVKMLSFVFGFVGRTAWSDSGLSSDLQGLYRDLRDIGVDRDSSLKIDITPSSGVKAYEILTSQENQKLGQMLSDFQHIVAWGRMGQKEELINKIVDLRNFETVHIDLAKGVEDLKKYPHIFGDPLDPKFQTVIKKMSSEKLTEKEHSSEKSATAKLGIGSMFSGEGGASKKKTSRMKDLVKFELEGELYVPKSLHFVVRTNDSFELMKTLVFQAYDHLEESYFRLGTGVSLNPIEAGPAFTTKSNSISAATVQHTPFDFACAGNTILAGIKSVRTPRFDRSFQHECRELAHYETPVQKGACQAGPNVNGYMQNFSFQCSDNQFLNGERSSYKLGDRIYGYQCCSLTSEGQSLKKKQCNWSGWLNKHSQTVSYSCPANSVLAGVQSEHLPFFKINPRKLHKPAKMVPTLGDRRFNYLCCSYGMD